ncbi:hypothetical protein NQ317_018937 [Molorchus minor]|uniref:ZP domain-containing protein n=1 Tax=Molorchus minor TaxID=1323400 RepID=A0ABQ9JCR7_9CUCU|nr:hypothetical protein NQ317_018937 [Molorchus minor]
MKGNDGYYTSDVENCPNENDDIIFWPDLASYHYARIFRKIREVDLNIVQRKMRQVLTKLRAIEDHGPLSLFRAFYTAYYILYVRFSLVSAKATQCLPHASEIEVATGPFFAGRIAVEAADGERCAIDGEPNSPRDIYTLRINHTECGSQVNDTTVSTFVLVQENLPILTHSTRRFLVLCSYQPETLTVRAGISLPTGSHLPPPGRGQAYEEDNSLGRRSRTGRVLQKPEALVKEEVGGETKKECFIQKQYSPHLCHHTVDNRRSHRLLNNINYFHSYTQTAKTPKTNRKEIGDVRNYEETRTLQSFQLTKEILRSFEILGFYGLQCQVKTNDFGGESSKNTLPITDNHCIFSFRSLNVNKTIQFHIYILFGLTNKFLQGQLSLEPHYIILIVVVNLLQRSVYRKDVIFEKRDHFFIEPDEQLSYDCNSGAACLRSFICGDDGVDANQNLWHRWKLINNNRLTLRLDKVTNRNRPEVEIDSLKYR